MPNHIIDAMDNIDTNAALLNSYCATHFPAPDKAGPGDRIDATSGSRASDEVEDEAKDLEDEPKHLHDETKKYIDDWTKRQDAGAGLLWLKGKAGASKATIMKHMVERGHVPADSEMVLMHHFYAREMDLEKSGEERYRTCLVPCTGEVKDGVQRSQDGRYAHTKFRHVEEKRGDEVLEQRCGQCSRSYGDRSLWGSWMTLLGIILLTLAQYQAGCGPGQQVLNISRGGSREWSEAACNEFYDTIAPYYAGALLFMESAYWLQVLDFEDDRYRRRELRKVLPIAVGTAVACLVTGHGVANSVLLCLPLATSSILTLRRLGSRRGTRGLKGDETA